MINIVTGTRRHMIKLGVIKTMALTNLIRRYNRNDVNDAVPLFQQTLCVNSLFACKCDRLDKFATSDREKSNEFIFSDVHGAMNDSGS